MKIWCLLSIFAIAANAFSLEEGRENGENGWYIPRDGSWEWIDIGEAEEQLDSFRKMEADTLPNPVTFHLFTHSNPVEDEVIETTEASIDLSHFNANHPTRFIIHGFRQQLSDSINTDIRDAWLDHGAYNIIVVDWSRARTLNYFSSVAAVPEVGEKVAEMIDFLNEHYGMSFENLVVIGHSLGAHAAGFCGKNVQRGQIGIIVGLDPALPLYSYYVPSERLNSGDAAYVETIQTSGGQSGFLQPIGTGTFYPNGGKTQPGCGWDLLECAHKRSVIYYVEAVKWNNFITIQCANQQSAEAKNCGSLISPVRMGAMCGTDLVPGIFYVPVNSVSPYGYGSAHSC